MSTVNQILASRENAKASTGPRTPEGKTQSSRNALTLGLFTMADFVRPEEQPEYRTLSQSLWDELRPQTPLQQTFAAEIVKATWRLRRCAVIEGSFPSEADSPDPMQNEATARLQTSVDRARAQSHNILRRSLAELRRLQSQTPAEAPAPAPGPAKSEITNPTQLFCTTGRNTPCPCGSGVKYKRCCGINAPAVLNSEARTELLSDFRDFVASRVDAACAKL